MGAEAPIKDVFNCSWSDKMCIVNKTSKSGASQNPSQCAAEII